VSGYRYHAHLLAEFHFIGNARAPVLRRFCVRGEHHAQITNNWRQGFYSTVLSGHSAESYEAAVKTLRRSTETLIPSVAALVAWGVRDD
jgi:hypothetical protein